MEEGRQIWEFDREFDRKSTCDLKWRKEGVMAYLNQKVQEDMIPMWIADTDFGCMEEIVETLKARAAHGIYGYCSTTPKFEERIAFWEQQLEDLSSMDHLPAHGGQRHQYCHPRFFVRRRRDHHTDAGVRSFYGDHKKDREVSCLQQAEKP